MRGTVSRVAESERLGVPGTTLPGLSAILETVPVSAGPSKVGGNPAGIHLFRIAGLRWMNALGGGQAPALPITMHEIGSMTLAPSHRSAAVGISDPAANQTLSIGATREV